ncbi:MAG: hypothetical protein GY757_19010 [bacterium]|nr:hypothetical protein [bacterium]
MRRFEIRKKQGWNGHAIISTHNTLKQACKGACRRLAGNISVYDRESGESIPQETAINMIEYTDSNDLKTGGTWDDSIEEHIEWGELPVEMTQDESADIGSWEEFDKS